MSHPDTERPVPVDVASDAPVVIPHPNAPPREGSGAVTAYSRPTPQEPT